MNDRLQKLFRPFFFLLPFIYFFLYGTSGFDDGDGGYVAALAYRVLNGEIPYRDVIIVRPALFVYTHALVQWVMPQDYYLLAERLFFYLVMAVVARMTTAILQRAFDFDRLNINPWLFSSIAFVFCVHNFPPMAWHTVDGLFFAITGIYFLTLSGNNGTVAAGMFFLFLSALTKQSFYPMPVVGLVWTALYHPRNALITGLIMTATLFLIFLAGMKFAGVWDDFVFWTAGSTNRADLLQSGITNYFRWNFLARLALVVAGFFGLRWLIWRLFKRKTEIGWLFVLVFLLVFSVVISRSFRQSWFHFQSNYPQALFLVAVGAAFFYEGVRVPRRDMATVLILLAVSWCVSISWGYASPVLYSAPAVFMMIYLAADRFRFSKMKFLQLFLFLGGLVSYAFASNRAYADGLRKELNMDMGGVFPKLSGIRSDKETFEKYAELKSLSAKYGPVFKTLPSMPLSNYLTGTRSPAGADWLMDIELNGKADVVLEQLKREKAVALVEKHPRFSAAEGQWGSRVTREVEKEWKLLEETGYFKVYRAE